MKTTPFRKNLTNILVWSSSSADVCLSSATDTDRKLIWKSSVKFRSAKVALYMKASCLVLSFYSFWKVLRFCVFHLSLFYLLLFLKFLTTWDSHTGKLTCIEGGSNANSGVCHSTELHTWTSLSVVRTSLRSSPGASNWTHGIACLPLQDWYTLGSQRSFTSKTRLEIRYA